jgi:hypothetical protein
MHRFKTTYLNAKVILGATVYNKDTKALDRGDFEEGL